MHFIQTYVVRIYRYAPHDPRAWVGTVEIIGQEPKQAFTGYHELWRILAADRSAPKSGGRGAGRRKRAPASS